MQANKIVQTPTLKVHNNTMPAGLLQIKKMFGEARHTPGHVYKNILSDRERSFLCMSAGLKRTELNKNWDEYTLDQRQALRKGLMQLNSIVVAFIDSNAMEAYKWIDGAKPNEPKFMQGSVVEMSQIKQAN
jgi:hypothetical protein